MEKHINHFRDTKKKVRLIDADALKAKFPVIEKIAEDLWYGAAIRVAIDRAPTVDAVEVVRCKDCKKSQKWKNAFGAEGLKCYLLCADIDPDDFCSYGERKDNG